METFKSASDLNRFIDFDQTAPRIPRRHTFKMQRLMEDISKLLHRTSDHLCDAQVIAMDGSVFSCHRDVLSMRSVELGRLLATNPLGEINLRKYDSTTVEWVLRFIYGEVRHEFPYELLGQIQQIDRDLKVRGLATFLRHKFGFKKEREEDDSEAFFDLSPLQADPIQRDRKGDQDNHQGSGLDHDTRVQTDRNLAIPGFTPRASVSGRRGRCGVNCIEITAVWGTQRESFRASRTVLSARSAYFNAMFSTKWAMPEGKKARTLLLEHIHPVVMKTLLDYAHTGMLLASGRWTDNLDFWLSVLHWGHYFGMESLIGEVEWVVSRNHLCHESLSKIWRAMPFIPPQGSRGLLIDDCVEYLERNMSSFALPCLEMEAIEDMARQQQHQRDIDNKQNRNDNSSDSNGPRVPQWAEESETRVHPPMAAATNSKIHDVNYLRHQAKLFYELPKDLLKAALDSGRVSVETKPLRQALHLWAKAQGRHIERKGFCIGDKVTIIGLKKRPALNGTQGIVKSDEKKGRHVVMVVMANIPKSSRSGTHRNPTLLRIKPINLQRNLESRPDSVSALLKELEPPATLFNSANRLRLEALRIIRRIQHR